MKKLLAAAALAVSLSGCQSLKYECTTKTGEIIKASSWSSLWSEEIEGFEYDHEKGILKIKKRTSGVNAESVKILTDAATDLVSKAAAAAAKGAL